MSQTTTRVRPADGRHFTKALNGTPPSRPKVAGGVSTNTCRGAWIPHEGRARAGVGL